MTRFEQDNRGRYVQVSDAPQTERSRPNFPPRLIIPPDTRHPVGLCNWSGWGGDARLESKAVRS